MMIAFIIPLGESCLLVVCGVGGWWVGGRRSNLSSLHLPIRCDASIGNIKLAVAIVY